MIRTNSIGVAKNFGEEQQESPYQNGPRIKYVSRAERRLHRAANLWCVDACTNMLKLLLPEKSVHTCVRLSIWCVRVMPLIGTFTFAAESSSFLDFWGAHRCAFPLRRSGGILRFTRQSAVSQPAHYFSLYFDIRFLHSIFFSFFICPCYIHKQREQNTSTHSMWCARCGIICILRRHTSTSVE